MRLSIFAESPVRTSKKQKLNEKVYLLKVSLLSFMAVNPQQTNVPFSIVGIYEIQAASTHELNHMHFFPRKNFIIQRGGIPKFKSVFGTEAEVTDVKYDAGGVPVVTLKPVNSRKLFRINPTGDTTICRRPWNLGN